MEKWQRGPDYSKGAYMYTHIHTYSIKVHKNGLAYTQTSNPSRLMPSQGWQATPMKHWETAALAPCLGSLLAPAAPPHRAHCMAHHAAGASDTSYEPFEPRLISH